MEVAIIKQYFFEKLGDENSIQYYQKAYIILLLKAFLDLADDKGEADFNEISRYFQEFYIDREKKGYQIESEPVNSVMKNIESSTVDDFKQIIARSPLKTKTLEDVFLLENNKLKINEELWQQLSSNDINQIKNILKKQLTNYFQQKVDGDSMAIPDVSKQEIIQALHEFDQKHRDSENWSNFTEKKNYKYAINYEGKLYPVKKII